MKNMIRTYIFITSLVLIWACGSDSKTRETSEEVLEEETSQINAPQLEVKALPTPTAEQVKAYTNKFTADLIDYTEAFNQGNWTLVTDYIYPKIFEEMSKSEMINAYQRMENSGMKVSNRFKTVERLSRMVKLNDETYCRIHYNSEMTMTLSGDMLVQKDMLENGIKESFGPQNVKPLGDGSYLIDSHKSMIGIYNENEQKWHYIEYTYEGDPNLTKFIPAEVLSQLN